jgi:S-DNA-T family DNA segregation ATPase FtsK/SpoIIIE
MAKTIKRTLDKKNNSKAKGKKSWVTNSTNRCWESFHLIFCCFTSCFYPFYSRTRRSKCRFWTNRSETVQNWLGKFGAFCWFNCLQGFGLASFLFVRLFSWPEYFWYVFLQIDWKESGSGIYLLLLFVYFIWFATSVPELGGTVGYELNLFLQDYIGKTGNSFDFDFGLIIYVIF